MTFSIVVALVIKFIIKLRFPSHVEEIPVCLDRVLANCVFRGLDFSSIEGVQDSEKNILSKLLINYHLLDLWIWRHSHHFCFFC